jgi:hypothetical protein
MSIRSLCELSGRDHSTVRASREIAKPVQTLPGSVASVATVRVPKSKKRRLCRRGGRARSHNGPSENHPNRSYRLAIHNVAAAEALVLGMKAGLDGAQVLRLVGEGAGSSRILQLRGPMMVKGRYRPPTMTLANFEKDLAIIAAFARKVGARTPLFSAAAPIYAAATRKNPSLDTAAVCDVLEKMAQR